MHALTCLVCHAPVPSEAAFCPRCGAPRPRPEGEPDPASEIVLADPALQARLGRVLGPIYEVRRMLCRGTLTDAFEVWDTRLDRRLVVKALRTEVSWTDPMLARFKHDTGLIARLSHPNVLPILFVGEQEGLAYLARPFVEGESLERAIRTRGPMTVDRTLELSLPLLDGLQQAHQLGLVHGAIRPSNILLDAATGRAILADFGSASLADCVPPGQRVRGEIDTLYLSPEQAFGAGAVDPRSDIYALGAVLFQMLTATLPLAGEAGEAGVDRSVSHTDEPAPVRAARAVQLPKWLADILLRCLARDREERFASAAELRAALAAGGASAETEAVSALPLARRIWGVEATVLVPGREEPTAKAATPPPAKRSAPRRRAGAAPPSRWLWLVPALLTLAALGFAAFELTRPALVLVNDLAGPVRLTINSEPPRTVAPGDTLVQRLGRGVPLMAEWTLERPIGPDGRPLGDVLRAEIWRDDPRGRIQARTAARLEDGDYFAPLVTNAGTSPLRIEVNAGLYGARDCRCAVPPGMQRAFLGYYPLFANSTVQARDSAGRTATFRDLGPRVQGRGGTVGLKFTDADFR